MTLRARCLAALVVAVLPCAAAAMSTRVASVAELVRRADLCLVGRAVARESFWREGRIFTRVTVQAEEVWKGGAAPGQTVEVLTLGGVVGALAQRVDGSVTVDVDERVALLLAREPGGAFVPLGLWQGVFRVDGQGPEAKVTRRVPAVRLVGAVPEVVPASVSALRRAVLEATRVER
jgi:hypothetical protein